jgi:hypothetical protein
MKPHDPQTTAVDDPRTAAASGRPSQDGAGTASLLSERYCAFCGVNAAEYGSAATRFGEPFCSEEHAEEFARGVRAARVQAAAAPATTGGEEPAGATRSSWASRLAKWGCWAAPLALLLAIPLVSSGQGLAATLGAVLPFLALLACPLAMLFMMRGMSGMNQGGTTRNATKDHAPERKDE